MTLLDGCPDVTLLEISISRSIRIGRHTVMTRTNHIIDMKTSQRGFFISNILYYRIYSDKK